MTAIFAKKAFVGGRWEAAVRLRIDGGRIVAVSRAASPESGDDSVGIVIPGLANAHSHAFQRALAGHAEHGGPAGRDTFWTWRQRMYALANRIDAESLTAIATQLYSEMLRSGYTSVAEFHYLHGDDMMTAIAEAAARSGIRITYVPILYERAGFDDDVTTNEQRRFAMSFAEFERHYDAARQRATDSFSVAIGAHSLRAVRPESLSQLAALSERDDCPMHLHIAEQELEVEQCQAHHGKRPVRWLVDNYAVDNRWCLVHATHMNDDEVQALLATNCIVCLCPSTEVTWATACSRYSVGCAAAARSRLGLIATLPSIHSRNCAGSSTGNVWSHVHATSPRCINRRRGAASSNMCLAAVRVPVAMIVAISMSDRMPISSYLTTTIRCLSVTMSTPYSTRWYFPDFRYLSIA